jgi:TetR/AcrR family transcriptional repressor of nem operon
MIAPRRLFDREAQTFDDQIRATFGTRLTWRQTVRDAWTEGKYNWKPRARLQRPASNRACCTRRYKNGASVMTLRTARGDETRRQILAAAADLFHKQGVSITSPDQVIDASGTGKGQFYHYFKNKEGLVHEVLQTYLEGIRHGRGPLSYEIASWDELERWFAAQVALQQGFKMARGCPFGTIGNEVTENDELIRQDLSLIFEVAKGKIATFFVKEKASGRLDPKVHEEQLADFCLATMQGAMLMGKVKRSSDLVQGVVREAIAHLKQYAQVAG